MTSSSGNSFSALPLSEPFEVVAPKLISRRKMESEYFKRGQPNRQPEYSGGLNELQKKKELGLHCLVRNCTHRFARESTYESDTSMAERLHCRRRHFDLRSWPCEFCCKRFHSYKALKRHFEYCHQQITYLCPQLECDFTTRKRKLANYHIQSHDDAGDGVSVSNDSTTLTVRILCSVPSCAKYLAHYETHDAFELHLFVAHQITRYKCVKDRSCLVSFKYAEQMIEHLEVVHREFDILDTTLNLRCNFCKEELVNVQSLIAHLREEHKGGRFWCPFHSCQLTLAQFTIKNQFRKAIIAKKSRTDQRRKKPRNGSLILEDPNQDLSVPVTGHNNIETANCLSPTELPTEPIEPVNIFAPSTSKLTLQAPPPLPIASEINSDTAVEEDNNKDKDSEEDQPVWEDSDEEIQFIKKVVNCPSPEIETISPSDIEDFELEAARAELLGSPEPDPIPTEPVVSSALTVSNASTVSIAPVISNISIISSAPTISNVSAVPIVSSISNTSTLSSAPSISNTSTIPSAPAASNLSTLSIAPTSRIGAPNPFDSKSSIPPFSKELINFFISEVFPASIIGAVPLTSTAQSNLIPSNSPLISIAPSNTLTAGPISTPILTQIQTSTRSTQMISPVFQRSPTIICSPSSLPLSLIASGCPIASTKPINTKMSECLVVRNHVGSQSLMISPPNQPIRLRGPFTQIPTALGTTGQTFQVISSAPLAVRLANNTKN